MPLLAWLVLVDVPLDAGELHAARRRALLVLAAGGDPHRELTLDDAAVERLATELDAPDRRDSLAAALAGLVPEAAGLPTVTAALDALQADADLAWHAFALALLADELAEEG